MTETNGSFGVESADFTPQARVKDVLRSAFPSGTSPNNRDISWKKDDFKADLLVPYHPADLFGLTASILDRSGAYNIFIPGCNSFDSPYAWFVSDAEMEMARAAGALWKKGVGEYEETSGPFELTNLVPKPVHDWWKVLVDAWEEPVFGHPHFDDGKSPPDWWVPCLLMLVAADEAAERIGRFSQRIKGSQITMYDGPLRDAEAADIRMSVEYHADDPEEDDDRLIQFRPTKLSIAPELNRDFACVQPKSKTPAVGCTLRTLSHNLSLLPHRGPIRTHWVRPPAESFGDAGRAGFNILMIPFPYEIDPDWFMDVSVGGGTHLNQRGLSWNWFKIKQNWLPERDADIADFLDFVRALIKKSQHHGPVHAIAFPEYSMNWKIFRKLTVMIRDEFKMVELLISGSKDNCADDHGNYVLSANFYNTLKAEDQPSQRVSLVTSRPKHHRWQLNEHQITSYGLDKVFDKKKLYWEHIPLPPRELHAVVFRENSVFSSLICEDLARSDPCHEILRAIGPNLLFVLLMDGAQLASRWSARYSTGLTDDPGTSVLTLTSRGLVKASNDIRVTQKDKNGEFKKANWSVALWKDDKGDPVSIKCEPEFQASLIRLRVESNPECTFDSRIRTDSFSWRKTADDAVYIDISDEHADLVKKFRAV